MPVADARGPEKPLVRRLDALRSLSEDAILTVTRLVNEKISKAAAGEDLVCEGDRCESVRLFLSGWACRYKTLEDGRRQIVSFILPGDTCDAHIYLFAKMDHSITALTPITYCELDEASFVKLTSSDKSLAEAFYCETLSAQAIHREWVTSIGRRDALERVAHLICELFERLKIIGLTEDKSFTFPVTQVDFADATGLSTVHLNRTLQELRAMKLIRLRERSLTILDPEALANTAMFSANYLHLDRRY